MRLFFRSIEVATDSRLKRYLDALQRHGRPYRVLFWQRGAASNGGDSAATVVPFRRPARVGARWGNLAGLVAWNLFVVRSIWSLRRTTDSVHAVDLDSALAAYACGALLGIPVIVDFYDSYPDSRGLRGAAAALARRLEGWLASRAALTIIADRARIPQHGIRSEANLLVIENVPAIDWSAEPVGDEVPLAIGYLGNLEARHRGLEHILNIVPGDPRFRLVIAGTGALEDMVRQAAARCDRIAFAGPVEHATGMALMAQCHVQLGLYYLSAKNHRFAAPNKYYEHLALGRPLITSRGTPPGDKVEALGTGWAIDDGADPLARLLNRLAGDWGAIKAAGLRARALWEKHYADYLTDTIDGHYLRKSEAIEKGKAG